MERTFDNEAAIRALAGATPADRRRRLGAIVAENHGLVRWHLDQIERRHGDRFPRSWREELEQAGRCGLWWAAERFDPERSFRFSTYAGFWIRREMFAALRAVSTVIDIPRRQPRHPLTPAPSLDAPTRPDDDRPLGELIVDGGLWPDVVAAYRERAEQIAAALARLPAREQAVIQEHYWADRTLTAIAGDLGVSREAVRQIKVRALGRLARALGRGAA